MAPTLAVAFKRKWWIAVTSVLENLMFAAVLLGWSSLLLMLKNEGFYSTVCVAHDHTHGGENETNMETNSTSPTSSIDMSTANFTKAPADNGIRYTPSGYPTCAKQDEILNRYFSIGSSLLSGVTIILGVIMDKYGSRMIRLCGTWAFMASCVLLAIGSLDTEHNSILIAPAVCLNGMGGVVYIFTSFPIPNLFENLRSTMISLMIGSYSASAVMYMIFKAAYSAGVPFVAIMLFHAGVGFLTFINCYINTPGEPIPGPDDISYAIKLRYGAFRFEHKISGKKFLHHTSTVGRRMSSVETTLCENHNYLASVDAVHQHGPSMDSEMSFLSILVTPCVLLSFLSMCLTQLRLIAYMGWLELYLRSSSKQQGLDEQETSETVDYYTFLFGLFQINCFFMAPVIGTIMDWNLKAKKSKKPKLQKIPSQDSIQAGEGSKNADGSLSETSNNKVSNGKPNGVGGIAKKTKNFQSSDKPSDEISKLKRKRQQVINLARAFMLTNLLLVAFGIIILFESLLSLQVLAFLIHTAVRTFLHSSVGGLYACMYHFSHFGKLTGLASFLSAMFILIQDPLFVWINSSFGGDPYWINFVMLLFSLTGFGLPIYLWRYAKTLTPCECIEERQMFSINEEGGNDEDEVEDEEPAHLVSSLALAL